MNRNLLGNLKIKMRLAAVLGVMIMMPFTGWGQTPDRSGTYYIPNNRETGYQPDGTTVNGIFYLCPSTSLYGADKPFVTTYITNKNPNSIWKIEYVSTLEDVDYYHIHHMQSDKYLKTNDPVHSNTDRARVHLEAATQQDFDNDTEGAFLFFFANESSGVLNICPKTLSDRPNGASLNPAKGNKNSYAGLNQGNPGYYTGWDGNRIYFGGIVGVFDYVDSDGASKWRLESASPATPTITNNYDGTITLACDTVTATIYYTTDGSDPTWINPGIGNTTQTYDGNPFTLPSTTTVIKAIAYKLYNGESQMATYDVPQYTAPTISFDYNTSKVSIDPGSGGTAYYNTGDGSQADPTTSSTVYSAPFIISSATTVKAIATHAGYLTSGVATLSISQVVTPTIQDNGNNAISITSATPGATFYYTTDGSTPTTSSTEYTGPLTENVSSVTIKAIAVKENMIISEVGSGSVILRCATPVITRIDMSFTLSCSMPTDANLYYRLDDGSETEYSGPVTFTSEQLPMTVTAVARHNDYTQSETATFELLNGTGTPTDPYLIYGLTDFSNFVTNVNNGTTASACYKLATNVSAIGTNAITTAFTGTFDGDLYTITDLTHPLFNIVDGGIVKNVKLDNVNITTGTNVGAICNEATGAARIYNCGILSGSVTGTVNVGGLVGLINSGSSVRVVNCYNYANVSGGTYAAGIVGKNEGTVGDVRIALCMMYGNISDATNISPVYTGNHIDNVKKFTEYNFFLYSNERDDDGDRIVKIPYTVLNDQLSINEEEYLTRFPFHLHILNTHRELAAFFLFGASGQTVNNITPEQIAEIGHWVVKKDLAPYPIVEHWATNTKKVIEAPTPSNILTEMGTTGYLTVNVSIDGHSYSAQLPITDMDEANFDYTWGKVVLPYANEFEVNTDYDRICTGWKITKVTKGSTYYTTSSFTDYNFADRNNPQKDIYSESNPYIFAQGGYYIVPYGVTAIEITANFATAYYLSDAQYETGYTNDYTDPTGLGGYVYNGSSSGSLFHNKTVYKNIDNVLDVLGEFNTPHSQAIVLVGNYHFPTAVNTNPFRNGDYKKAFTLMSIDADNNQEPDYAFYSVSATTNLQRPRTPAMRFDFVALIPVGMAAHVNGSRYYPGLPIWNPSGWFEMTETSLTWTNQFELASSNFTYTGTENVNNYRIIINSGYYVQMVRSSKLLPCNLLSYAQIGGKTYIKEYYPGSHSANAYETKLVPVNVTGGEIEQCFMTGYGYKKSTNSYGTAKGDNIYFWCAGGKIGKFLGAFMETPVPASEGYVDMTAKIDHALIKEFYGGGTSPLSPITGDINVTIDNSRVDFYCGGPEFGDMTTGKTVTTTATNSIFGEYFGAGFGGTAIVYFNYEDLSQDINWPSDCNCSTTNFPDGFFSSHYYPGRPTGTDRHGRLIEKAGGIGSRYKFEYIVHSYDKKYLVARFYTGFANFDFATTGDVTNTLTGCTILNNFFGAGCQGKVNGRVTSTLTDCTVNGSAYGAGFKASANEVEVYPTTPPYELSQFTMETGIFSEFKIPDPETFLWKEGTAGTSNDVLKELYTDKPMTTLGDVSGKVTITLNGNTTVQGSLFGGGFESKSLNDTEVHVYDHTHVFGNIYGGGNKGLVGGNSKVLIENP